MKVIAFVTFMDILFMSLAAATIFIFRARHGVPAVFSVKTYPLLPLVYLLISATFVVYTLLDLNEGALAGLVILALGMLAYYYFKRVI